MEPLISYYLGVMRLTYIFFLFFCCCCTIEGKSDFVHAQVRAAQWKVVATNWLYSLWKGNPNKTEDNNKDGWQRYYRSWRGIWRRMKLSPKMSTFKGMEDLKAACLWTAAGRSPEIGKQVERDLFSEIRRFCCCLHVEVPLHRSDVSNKA